jgi:hypothetical protein
MAKASTQTGKGKTTAPPPPNKSNSKAVATSTKNANAVAEASEDALAIMRKNAGKGVSTAIEDNVVPLVYILQALSPQVQKKKEEYIQDAEAGMIWFRGTKDLVAGEEGIPVVLCHASKCWIEWMPDRGGYVGRHPGRPAEATLVTDAQNPKKKFWRMKNGNTVVETREHVVLVLDIFERPMPFVIPMSGSNHQPAREWMSMANRKVIPGTDLKAPLFGYIYRMKLKFRTNDQGDWFMWDIQDEGGEPTILTDVPTLVMANQISDDFEKGVLKADNATGDQVDDTADGGGGKDNSERDKHI